MPDPIKVGMIGCGGMATGHARRLLALSGAKVVALCDPSRKMLERFVERVPDTAGLPTYSDYHKMLDNEQLEAVEIASPHTVHFEQIMDSLRRGLHVLVEKPMVCTTEHARKVVREETRTGKVVLVSYQRHYQPAYRYVRETIAAGGLGEILFVSAIQAQNWLSPTKGSWRQKPSLSGGGQLNDSGSHLIDIMLWTTGQQAASVFAFQDKRGSRVDILSALSVKFRSGAIGNISIIGDTPVGFYEEFSVWGEKGTLIVRDGALLHQDAKGAKEVTPTAKYKSDPDKNLIDAIRGRDEVQSPAEGGLRVIQLTEAAWKSAATGGPVTVRAS